MLTKVNRSYVKVQEVLANVGGFMKTLMIISNYLTKGYSEYVFLKRVEAVFEFEEIRKSKKEMNVNNLVLPNQKESAVEMKLKINKFKTGVGVTEMKALDTSVISYLKYFFVNCCKKKNGELEQYLKYIDFKHVFAEIIRIKENLEEIGVTNHQHIPIA